MGKVKVAVIGATGYAGQELVRLLAQHPDVEVSALTSQQYAGQDIATVFPNLRKAIESKCREQDLPKIAETVDIVFMALPHGVAVSLVTDDLLSRTRVIDLGSDFRLEDPEDYVAWYHGAHANPQLLDKAIYGLCEWNRAAIAGSRLVANPGCYATCTSLALSPLVKAGVIEGDSIIVDAKSGVSGAGRALALGVHFNECNETIKAYAVVSHRHTPEIEMHLNRQSKNPVTISFTPHLVPMNRGILVTVYAKLKGQQTLEQLESLYLSQYGEERFIRLCFGPSHTERTLPETRWVKGSNYCDIGLAVDGRTGRVIVVAALDNLIKGAAGQAVQNMNIMFGLPEHTGLTQVPLFP